MAIRLYNTRTRQKEVFEPLDPKNVRMYVCGPTVYDRAHIGNARPVVVFDVLFRLLRHTYGGAHVTYARNFTDVDDKINAKAAETRREGETLEQTVRRITDETIGWYHEDMDALGALRPTHEPRATEYIAQMVAMIEDLIARGHAYAAEGHVLFEARTDPDYGSLSRRPLDEMRAGARVEVAPYKRDPMDSVLWKPSTDEQPGWDSPWGRGRPGWHIECSAMAGDLLGEAFDIHGGGIDLQFPHHENECAQSRCVGHDFANIWMHNGYLLSEGEKMSKSLGNFFTVADLRAKGVPGEVMRLAMLMTHYRSPIDWTEKALGEAEAILRRWRKLAEIEGGRLVQQLYKQPEVSGPFMDALRDDLNTPKAIAVLHDAASSGNTSYLIHGANLLGLLTPELEWRMSGFDNEVQAIIQTRNNLKSNKQYEWADIIRQKLANFGVILKDSPSGTTFEIDDSTMRMAHAQRRMAGTGVMEANWSQDDMKQELTNIIASLNADLEKRGLQ